MRVYFLFNKIHNSSLTALIISSVILLCSQLLALIAGSMSGAIALMLNNFSSAFLNALGYIFCYFVTQYITSEKKGLRSFWSVLCLLLLSTALSGSVSFIVGLLMAYYCNFFFERFNTYIAFAVTSISSVIFGIFWGHLSDAVNNIQMNVAYAVAHKGIASSVIFGVLTVLLSLFGNSSFADLFFYKSYGGSVINNEQFVTGIKDLFADGYSGELIANYMSGHFLLLFALAGIALSLADELKGAQKSALIIVTAASLISGNITFLIFFILLEGWSLMLSVLLLAGLSYLTASVLDIRIGYLYDGGIIEMLMNMNKPAYLLLAGLVFVAIGYFTTKYSCLKFGISDAMNIYIPTRLNKLVGSLGGIVNIIKIKNGVVEVRNPKLVNNFEIECEIRGNCIKVNDDKISDLKDYL